MDQQPISPEQLPSPPDLHLDMATLVVPNNHHSNMPAPGVNKRYRPAPAKTFQCRGYGECRMVFSRSEHLARHIRKHTGERPFSCHCAKQFSRLDNLRQHAQTVHADKQEQNERMMRDLTSLHASMAAANKAGQPRAKRSQTSSSSNSSGSPVGNGPNSASPTNGSSGANSVSANHVKVEDDSQSVLPVHQRPGTTSGYEADHNGIISANWHVQTSDMNLPTSRPTNSHSFRDPGQSFLAPSPSTSATAQSQSFLPFTSSFNFALPDSTRDGRPGSGSNRPPTSDSHPRSLPPLASVLPASISPPQPQPPPFSAQQHVLHFPAFRRPSTATRPGTAPASYYSAKPPYIGGAGVVPRSELPFYTNGRDLAAPQPPLFDTDITTSPLSGTAYDSPFSFHPPALNDQQPAAQGTPQPPNHRKRAFAGADGPEYGGADYEYDYGTESRPQSRRLSVMELCNDQPPSDHTFLFLSGSSSRPGTSSGLVTSANALALIDRSPTLTFTSGASGASPPLLPGATAGAIATAPGGGSAMFGGGRVSPATRGSISTSAAAAILQPVRGSPTLSDASAGYSPRSHYSTRSPQSPLSASARGLQPQSKPPSPAATDVLSRRGGVEPQHDQVRIPVSSHTAAPVGMRV